MADKKARRKSKVFTEFVPLVEPDPLESEQLKDLYLNKNFEPPEAKTYETLFEGSKRGCSEDGTLILGKSCEARTIHPYKFWKQDDKERLKRRKVKVQKMYKGRKRAKTVVLNKEAEAALIELIEASAELATEDSVDSVETTVDYSLSRLLRTSTGKLTKESSQEGQKAEVFTLSCDSTSQIPGPLQDLDFRMDKVASVKPLTHHPFASVVVECEGNARILENIDSNGVSLPGKDADALLSVSQSSSVFGSDLVGREEFLKALDDCDDLLFCGTQPAKNKRSRDRKRDSVRRSVRRSARFINDVGEGDSGKTGSVFAIEEVLLLGGRRRAEVGGPDAGQHEIIDPLGGTPSQDEAVVLAVAESLTSRQEAASPHREAASPREEALLPWEESLPPFQEEPPPLPSSSTGWDQSPKPQLDRMLADKSCDKSWTGILGRQSKKGRRSVSNKFSVENKENVPLKNNNRRKNIKFLKPVKNMDEGDDFFIKCSSRTVTEELQQLVIGEAEDDKAVAEPCGFRDKVDNDRVCNDITSDDDDVIPSVSTEAASIVEAIRSCSLNDISRSLSASPDVVERRISRRLSTEVNISLPESTRRSLTGEFVPFRPLLSPEVFDRGCDLSQTVRSEERELPPTTSLSSPWSDSEEEELISGIFGRRTLGPRARQEKKDHNIAILK